MTESVNWFEFRTLDPRRNGDAWTVDFKTFHIVRDKKLDGLSLSVTAGSNWRDLFSSVVRSFAGKIWHCEYVGNVATISDVTHNFNLPAKPLIVDGVTDEAAKTIAEWVSRNMGPREIAATIKYLADELVDEVYRR